ncbi:titin-like [Acanthopagrus schlegelii]
MYEWTKDNLNTPPTHNEHRIIRATEADSGEYRCKGRRDSYSSTRWSDVITLTVSSNSPKAELRADDRDIPVGGSVTLTCSVKPSSSGWKYFWYRGEKTSEPLSSQLSAGPIRVSEGGVYWCRGGRGDPVYYTEYSDPVTIYKKVPNKAVVTLQPNWSEIFRGERITLRCEIKDGGDTVWEYEWRTTSSEKPSNQNELSIRSVSVSHSGVYRCKGRKKREKSPTDWSDSFILTVSDKAQSVLTVSPSWLSAGASVTLNCRVKDQSAGWRFYWYKTVPDPSDNFYSYELLPGSSSGTEQDSYIVDGQTHTAGYVCRAGRGDPVFYTDYSQPQFVWSADFHSSASLTVSPDRAQHFTSDSVSLSCEGNSTEWRVRKLSPENRYLSDCSTWGTKTGSTCKIKTNWLSDAVYWCESGSGEFSNSVNITIQNKNMILLSPARPVTEGDSVSLSCKLRAQKNVSIVFFYHNEKVIQSDTRWELNISAVSKSDEGFYKCQHSGQESAQSWMSVQAVSRPEHSSFPVLLIVGLICGIVLILLLLLLYRYRASKYTCFRRPIQSESSNTDQNEAQCSTYDSLLHGDVCLYETIKRAKDTENVAGGSQDVTYSSIEQEEGLQHTPEEPIYSNCRHGSLFLFIRCSFKLCFLCNTGFLRRREFTLFSALNVMMGLTFLRVLWLFLLNILLYGGHAQDSVLTIEPNWSSFFTGESVTLTCDMRVGLEADWYYRILKDGQDYSPYLTNKIYILENLITGHSGEYQCFGHYKSTAELKKSINKVSLTVLDNNVILASPASTMYQGESVTLRCRHRTQRKEKNASFYRDGSLILSNNTVEISVQLLSDSSSYMCKFDEDEESQPVRLKVEPHRPKADLRKDNRAYAGATNVTLTCSVNPSSPGWKYFWYRGKKTSEPLTTQDVFFISNEKISVSQGALYWCRGGRGEPVYYTEYSNSIATNKAVVTLQPSWPEIYYHEMITLKCEIENGGDTEWEYAWMLPRSYLPYHNQNEYMIRDAQPSDAGDYKCMGREKSGQSQTQWSDSFRLAPSDKAQPVLTVSPSWLSAGASVTLNCRVKDQSAGWRFYWYKTVPDPSDNFYSYELLPGSSSGTEQDSYIVDGQTHTAGYVCRAGRGDPVFYTDYSQPQFVWSGDFHSSASLTVSPDRAQHFTSDSVSLSCEGNSTEWRVRRSPENRYLSDCSTWRTMTGPTCKLKTNWLSDAVYWCESGSGEFSNSVNITIQNKNMILLSPARPVTEGDSVSLSCKLRNQTFDSIVSVYHNEKVIQSDTRWELNISAVSKSDEGFYKCQHSGQESAQSWMSVQAVSRPESSSVPVLLIVGLVCGVVLVIPLLVLFCYRASDDSCFVRPVQSESSNTDHVDYENDPYSTLLHGDVCLYETIRGRKEAEHANRPKAELRADDRDIPVGGSVTLTCSVKPSSSGWKYFWYRGEKTSEPLSSQLSAGPIRASEGGVYWCRGGRGDPVYYTEYSDPVTVYKKVPNKAVVTLQPNWSEIFRGERITLRCEIKDGGDTEWEYEWSPDYLNTPTTYINYRIIRVTSAHSGEYRCKGRRNLYSLTEWSDVITLTVSSNRPKAELRADDRDIPVGGSVTLTCSVKPSSSGWKYFWYRGEKTSEPLSSQLSAGPIRVSEGGVYWCRGGRGDPVYYTEFSDPVTINKKVPNKAVVTLQPNWSEIFRGERITLRCEIKDGGDTEWEYEWRTSSSEKPSNQNELSIRSVSASHSGVYRCKGRKKREKSPTDWSDSFILTVSDTNRPKAELRADDRDIPVGGSVTLTCSVKPSSSGWKYFWYRGEKTSEPLSSQLSAGPIRVSEGGVYWCRGGRGDPVYYTEYSDPVTIYKKVPNKAVVTLQPNWSEIYRGERITLRCEIKDGGDTEWEYEWRTSSSEKPSNQNELSIRSVSASHSGDYRCKSRKKREKSSTDWSDPFILTVSDTNRPKAELRADDRDIPVGGSVTLTCSVKPSSSGWKYFWYRGEKTSEPLNSQLSAGPIRVSEGGVYWCRGGRGDPVYYTEYSDPVTVSNNVPKKTVVTLQPNWSEIYRGERITLRCQIKDGGDTEWEYEWSPASLNTPTTYIKYRIITVTEADNGEYRCKGRRDSYSSTEWSDVITLTVSSNRPKAELRADDRHIPVGGSVTLTCSVKPSSSGWKYFWYRGEKTSEALSSQLSAGPIRVSEGGVYWCRGGRGDPVYYAEYSDPVTVYKKVPIKAVVTLQPNWSEIFRGERITLRCEIKDGGNTVWEYEWRTTSSEKPSNQNELSIRSVSASHSGVYRCKGRKKREKSSTDWSDPFKLTVSDKPQSVLTVSPSWLSAGASVTLNCRVKDQSAGWRFYWYKTVPDPSDNFYSYELLPGSSSGTEQDSYIVDGQTHTAGYVCRAGRGDPVFYTDYSQPQFVWSADFHSSASLTVSPDRAQHFTSDSVSLSCEGNSTEWRVRRSPENRYLSDCSTWRTVTGSTCKLKTNWLSDAVYWCESGSGEFSNAVNITIQNKNMILLSPARPVTEGDSVSLSCKLRRQTFDSTVFFYHNEKVIQNDTRWELNISAVSKSDEGFYKCHHSGQESAQSWMSVQAVSRPEHSSFPVLLIVGLICGIVLILLLLLLYRYRASKYTCFKRPIQSESSNTDQNEAQCSTYDSPQHGDVCLYETIKHSEDSEHVAGGSQDVTYSSVKLKHFGRRRKQHTPEERSVYSDVRTGAADDSLLYAQVFSHDKDKKKKKKKKGRSAPAAADETFYSEVKPGSSLGL